MRTRTYNSMHYNICNTSLKDCTIDDDADNDNNDDFDNAYADVNDSGNAICHREKIEGVIREEISTICCEYN